MFWHPGGSRLGHDLEPSHLLESEQEPIVALGDQEKNASAVTTAHDGPRRLHVYVLRSQWLDLAAPSAFDGSSRHLPNEHLAENAC